MRRAMAVPILLAAVTACGTTVPPADRAADLLGAVPGAVTDGSELTVGSQTAGNGLEGRPPSAAGPGAEAAGSASTAVDLDAGVPSRPSARRPGPARGVTSRTITVGIALPSGTDEVAAAFGIAAQPTTSARAVADAAVREINRQGGILGRELALYVHEYDAAQMVANPDPVLQAMCSDFRDDHPVFAVIFDLPEPLTRRCLAEMGSPLLVAGSFAVMPEAAYRAYGGSALFGINTISAELQARLMVASLMERNFTQTWNTATGGPGSQPLRLGLVRSSAPDAEALYAAYARELKKHGLAFAQTYVVGDDTSTKITASQSAVLKFQSEGITHVFGASAWFLKAAENQGYRPRYAFQPGLGKLGVDNVPANQMRGALTIGYSPAGDVADSEDPGDTAARTACRDRMAHQGLKPVNRADENLLYKVCDVFFSLRLALVTGGEATPAGLRRGWEAIGSRFAPAATFATLLNADRHFGVAAVRDMHFDSACGCLRYSNKRDRR